ncbi:MAG TPA: HlyD family secretion protein [Gemmatimonadaceae bacterium]|nr:HlyD family secretion protein [Gemmatimonadaceae bacterium]
MATMVDEETEQHSENRPATPERQPAAPAKRKYVVPIVAIVALIALGWGLKAYLYSRVHESTDDAQVDGHIIPVLAKVGGYVASVHVQDNDSVHAGDTLATIDDDEYRVKVAQAEADLAAARFTVGSGRAPGQARAAVTSATSQSAAQDAQIVASRAEYDQAQSDLTRMKSLAAKQIVSGQQLDAAQAAADAAAANLQAVERQAAAGNAGVTSAQAGVRVAQARTEAAQAVLDDARLQLSYTVITAPVSGTVSKKLIELGQLLQAGQTLMSVVADTGAYITANFKETQLANMRVGQPVEIDVDAYPGCTAEGKVQSLSAATGARFALLPPDNATGNFTKVVQRVPVRVLVTKGCGPNRPLRQGLSVVAHVKTG